MYIVSVFFFVVYKQTGIFIKNALTSKIIFDRNISTYNRHVKCHHLKAFCYIT